MIKIHIKCRYDDVQDNDNMNVNATSFAEKSRCTPPLIL
jgi:hypothetical protein